MSKRRIVDLREKEVPLLDVVSYGRRGPDPRPLTKVEIEHISRTGLEPTGVAVASRDARA